MLAVGCVAAGLVHAFRLAAPPRTDLVVGVGRWDHARIRASREPLNHTPDNHSVLDSLSSWVAESLTRRGRDLTRTRQDLAITGSSLEQHLSRVLGLALVGLLGPSAVLAILRVAGLGLPVSLGLVAGIGLAAAMVVGVRRELHATAQSRRAEFRRSLSVYLDLVAMSMEAGRGHSEALPAAAEIGSGWTFTHLQDAIDGARYSGIAPWVSLGRLGERIGMPELTDLDSALRLAHDDGAKVKATLVARAGTLRAQRIADAEADANQNTESMKFTLIVMVFAFLAYELYPSIVRLFAG